jgi:polyhydroxyalkanoate synthesis repressor PhaR
MAPALVVKKYPNRRLYDTDESRYITMEELAARVRSGRDVRILDAKTDDDLTQHTLLQLVLEGPGARLLPVPLLTQLVRMGDDALAEFFGRYMTWALEVYFAARQQAQSSWNPLAQVPFNMGGAFARMLMGGGQPGGMAQPMAPPPPPVPSTPAPPVPQSTTDLADLRRELEDLKKSLRASAAPKQRGRRKAAAKR